ncbi:MAG: hypothetical protein GY806_10425 [Gammaproteobacteria bacterium]|nr:hypothetical protein [Gammaproteobacteria bacterium]
MLKKLAIFIMLLPAFSTSAAILTFDDIPGASQVFQLGEMPSYKGFDYSSNLWWIDVENTVNRSYGAHSGDFALLNNYFGTGVITHSLDLEFVFGGLWAKIWGTPKDSGISGGSLRGSLSGYNNGVQIWTTPTVINGSYSELAAFSSIRNLPIDTLHIDLVEGNGNAFLVDDISLSGWGGASSSVPIIPTIWLFGPALIGLVAFSKRRGAKSQESGLDL